MEIDMRALWSHSPLEEKVGCGAVGEVTPWSAQSMPMLMTNECVSLIGAHICSVASMARKVVVWRWERDSASVLILISAKEKHNIPIPIPGLEGINDSWLWLIREVSQEHLQKTSPSPSSPDPHRDRDGSE
jgi:hypothetical protein